MEPLLTHVAGVDVHKEMIVITALFGDLNKEPNKEQWSAKTFTEDLAEAGKKLLALGIKHVAMESTGVYWKPIYNVWHPLGLIITLGNAGHIKNVPGRKTDIKDSEWIAMLHRCGLIRSSFIPETEYQQLRLLNRHRSNLVEDIARVKSRVDKVLEDGNIKLSSIVSNIFSPVGMAVLDSLSEGKVDIATLMSRVYAVGIQRLKRKEEMRKALTNCLREDHCFLIKQLMHQYIDLQQRLVELDNELDRRMAKHAGLLAKLDEVPGIDKITARGIIAEATSDMSSFKNDRMFAAWAGVAAGNHESAGKKKESKPDMVIPSFEKS